MTPQFSSRPRDRGAVAVVVALVVTFIALPALALSVDMGNIMFERRQLQNGTDAASLALAQTCADVPSNCNASLTVTSLNTLASANAADNSSQLNTAVGSNGQCARPPKGISYTGMPLCASASATATQQAAAVTDLEQCPPLSDYFSTGAGKDLGYVETYVRTKSQASDNTLLPNIFAKTLTGGTHQTSCARAAWGPAAPSTQSIVSLTMSECDWATQTGYSKDPVTGVVTQPTFPDSPVYSSANTKVTVGGVPRDPGYDSDASSPAPPWPTVERGIYAKGNPTTCDTSSPGGTAPGGFAWLDGAASCVSTIDTNYWVQTKPGSSSKCTDAQFSDLVGTVIFVPVFDCMSSASGPNPVPSAFNCNDGSGKNLYYHISGFAGFYLTGYYFNPPNQVSIKTGNYLCANGDRCMSGWFTRALIPAQDFTFDTGGVTPPYGLTKIQPAG